ncbi:lipase family alpha/beta hydrolase [Nocardioides stalactiti]|uniref:lipase family alpha/beta hydrolase n=1 Tax=Nocardioides stalactiti TaxID=2755356 RepID=UPI001601FAE1|nr:lipase [Nocardioides stalactiti]
MRAVARRLVGPALALAAILAAGAVASPESRAAAPAPSVTAAVDGDYAPVSRPGPALRASAADLRAAVTCAGDFASGKQPVLLVPGTAFTYESQYAWSWAPALTRAGIPWCSVTPPHNSLGDLTIAGEYDAYAIRHTYRKAGGRKIAIVGHSQGGMRPRWALRFFPDTRRMVADYVGVAPDSQGVTLGAPGLAPALAGAVCGVVGCPQGVWQQLQGSAFMAAINSRQETFAGIDYSVIYSTRDGLVAPETTHLAAVRGAGYRRVAVQDLCPGRIADHFTNGSTDAATWALVIDAVTRSGPVDPARLSPSVCRQPFLPGLDQRAALLGALQAPVQIATAIATTPRENAEAALPCYVYATGC